MNKHIKKLISILGNNPSYEESKEASAYLKQVISSGEFNPEFCFEHPDKGSFKSVAITLPAGCIGETCDETVEFGEIKSELLYTTYAQLASDYYEWVNLFVCVSADGKDCIVGDFEDIVYFSSKKFYNKFTANHPVKVWDYRDI